MIFMPDLPILALNSNPEQVAVEFRRLVRQALSVQGESTLVRFEGRVRQTQFKSEGLARKWACEAVFSADEHFEAERTLHLLEVSFSSPDGRLTFFPSGANRVELDAPMVVTVDAWNVDREPGGVVRLTFELVEVDGEPITPPLMDQFEDIYVQSYD